MSICLRKILIIVFVNIITFLGLSYSVPVYAAEMFFDSAKERVYTGEEFSVSIKLDPEGVSINAVEGTITYDNQFIEVNNVRVSGSIINTWIEYPKVKNKSISFSGIIPGGFKGIRTPFSDTYNPGTILTLDLTAVKTGQAKVALQDVFSVENSSQAKQMSLSDDLWQMNIEKSTTSDNTQNKKEIETVVKDSVPPEDFDVHVIKRSDIFEGNYALLFSTTDTLSGVDRYEVREGDYDKWQVADSPYILKDQTFKNPIWVKAVDEAGNERVKEVNPPKVKSHFQFVALYIILIISILFLGFFFYYKKRNREL